MEREHRAAVLPSGIVTFLFTDIEASTKKVSELGGDRWHDILREHASVMRTALRAGGGVEVQTAGDSFFAVFPDPVAAVVACATAQRAFARVAWPHGTDIRVRMGMHTGQGEPASADSGADYVGIDVNRAARVAAAAHGGQLVITAATAAAVEGSLDPALRLRFLGEHRLKDLARRERIYQVVIDDVPSDFPPLNTLDRTPTRMPVQLTSFIGREQEIAAGLRLLKRTRALTLVGPGGTGKTRLALQIAVEALDRFPDGAFFVDVAAITDPELLPSAIATALDVQLQGTRPPLEQLIAHLAEKRTLLLLDNLEQVLAAGAAIAELLKRCGALTALITSRVPLDFYGEQQMYVIPLALPDPATADPEALARSDAVRLFLERARAIRPVMPTTADDARTIARICARVDGLPLAIELAAARVNVLTPHAILERLEKRLTFLGTERRDRPERRRTLRETIAWSYELLDPEARALFARLSVFAGGADLPEIEDVCGPPEQIGADVLDAVSTLVSHSLLRQEATDEPRFYMLETIREFAAEQLDRDGSAAELERRHAAVLARIAQRAAADLFGLNQELALGRFEREHDNLRAAIDRSIAAGAVAELATLVSSCWRFWQMRGHLREARERAARALSVIDRRAHPREHMLVLEALGGIAYWRGDLDGARDLYHQQVELCRQVGDTAALANALYNEACSYLRLTAPHADALAIIDEAVAHWRSLDDPAGIAKGLWTSGTLRLVQQQFTDAAPLLRESVDRFRALGDRFQLAWALAFFGNAEMFREGADRGAARAALSEALGIFAVTKDLSGISIVLLEVSRLALATGDRDGAIKLAAASRAMTQRVGTTLGSILGEVVGDIRPEELREDERAAWSEGAQMSVDEAVAFALAGPDARVA